MRLFNFSLAILAVLNSIFVKAENHISAPAFNVDAFNEIIKQRDQEKMISLMQKTGLDVFGIDPKQKLPLPPAPILNQWKQNADANQKNGQYLSGEFFRGDDKFGDYEHKKPFVIIAPSASLTVIIHEYHHYLFQIERLKHENYESRASLNDRKKILTSEFSASLDKISTSPLTFAKSVQNLIDVSWQALEQSSIEEAWIAYDIAKATKTNLLKLTKSELKEHCKHGFTNIALSRKPFTAFDNLMKKIKRTQKNEAWLKIDKKLEHIKTQLTELEKLLQQACGRPVSS